jgi:hypothetical protein
LETAGHSVRLLVGPMQPLRAVQSVAPMARIFALTPAASPPAPMLWVLPLDEDVHDALHLRFGTGEWLKSGAQLTTTDLVTLGRLSAGSALAYLETAYSGPDGTQSAVVWRDGQVVMQPVSLDASVGRPAQFWPINAALRALGVMARPTEDEFTVFGLMAYRSHAMITERATEVRGV